MKHKKVAIPDQLMAKAIPIISKIAKSRKNKNKFAYFSSDDIHQEIWILCLDALSRYNSESGQLEHYLNSHVTNRLKNLKRDKYFRPDIVRPDLSQKRINIVNALGLDSIGISEKTKFLASSSPSPDPLLCLEAEDLKEHIIRSLPPHLVVSFENLLDGKKIKKTILEELRSCILEILKEKSDAV